MCKAITWFKLRDIVISTIALRNSDNIPITATFNHPSSYEGEGKLHLLTKFLTPPLSQCTSLHFQWELENPMRPDDMQCGTATL
jgi:hypothetical protein